MRMSDSCRQAEVAGGFTLLELLIVLAIIAGAAAMVVPRLQVTYDAIVASGERAEVRRSLERLPLRAREAGEGFRFAPGDAGAAQLAAVVPVPDGWGLWPRETVVVHATGVCEPARIDVSRNGVSETWRLDAPLCRVDDGTSD